MPMRLEIDEWPGPKSPTVASNVRAPPSRQSIACAASARRLRNQQDHGDKDRGRRDESCAATMCEKLEEIVETVSVLATTNDPWSPTPSIRRADVHAHARTIYFHVF